MTETHTCLCFNSSLELSKCRTTIVLVGCQHWLYNERSVYFNVLLTAFLSYYFEPRNGNSSGLTVYNCDIVINNK